MASLMSLLTGHRPGAFEGFQMKDLFDKDRWERKQRQVQNPRFADEGLPPQMTNWYKGRGTPEANVIKTRDTGGAPIYQGPQQQDNAKLFPLRPSPNIQAQKLSATFRNPYRNPESVSTRSNPMKTSYAPYSGGFRQDQMGGGLVAPPPDIATEEEVEAMNAYRNQMLTDLLAETSEEPEVKAISYYKKKKKRSPKTYRSQSRGYRLKRI